MSFSGGFNFLLPSNLLELYIVSQDLLLSDLHFFFFLNKEYILGTQHPFISAMNSQCSLDILSTISTALVTHHWQFTFSIVLNVKLVSQIISLPLEGSCASHHTACRQTGNCKENSWYLWDGKLLGPSVFMQNLSSLICCGLFQSTVFHLVSVKTLLKFPFFFCTVLYVLCNMFKQNLAPSLKGTYIQWMVSHHTSQTCWKQLSKLCSSVPSLSVRLMLGVLGQSYLSWTSFGYSDHY